MSTKKVVVTEPCGWLHLPDFHCVWNNDLLSRRLPLPFDILMCVSEYSVSCIKVECGGRLGYTSPTAQECAWNGVFCGTVGMILNFYDHIQYTCNSLFGGTIIDSGHQF